MARHPISPALLTDESDIAALKAAAGINALRWPNWRNPSPLSTGYFLAEEISLDFGMSME